VGLVQTSPPDAEPLGLDELKNWLRVDESADDGLITALISAARQDAERFTRRQLVTATWRLTLDAFPHGGPIILPRPPLQSVTSITYTDANGDAQTLDASAYQVDASAEPARILPAVNGEWPDTQGGKVNAVAVTFVAGYGTKEDVPDGLKVALQAMIAHWYEHREAVADGSPCREVPMGVQRLLWSYRVYTAC
jgi:uncharacterized phiE125 gp8 family phage protein